MLIKKILTIFLFCFSIVGMSAEVMGLNEKFDAKESFVIPAVQKNNSLNLDERYLRKVQTSISCGMAPLPPMGCRVGSCVCDSRGQNCQWTFICR